MGRGQTSKLSPSSHLTPWGWCCHKSQCTVVNDQSCLRMLWKLVVLLCGGSQLPAPSSQLSRSTHWDGPRPTNTSTAALARAHHSPPPRLHKNLNLRMIQNNFNWHFYTFSPKLSSSISLRMIWLHLSVFLSECTSHNFRSSSSSAFPIKSRAGPAGARRLEPSQMGIMYNIEA